MFALLFQDVFPLSFLYPHTWLAGLLFLFYVYHSGHRIEECHVNLFQPAIYISVVPQNNQDRVKVISFVFPWVEITLWCHCFPLRVCCLIVVWPQPAFSVSSTFVDLNLPAASQPSSRYVIYVQRPGEQSFTFFGSYPGEHSICLHVVCLIASCLPSWTLWNVDFSANRFWSVVFSVAPESVFS